MSAGNLRSEPGMLKFSKICSRNTRFASGRWSSRMHESFSSGQRNNNRVSWFTWNDSVPCKLWWSIFFFAFMNHASSANISSNDIKCLLLEFNPHFSQRVEVTGRNQAPCFELFGRQSFLRSRSRSSLEPIVIQVQDSLRVAAEKLIKYNVNQVCHFFFLFQSTNFFFFVSCGWSTVFQSQFLHSRSATISHLLLMQCNRRSLFLLVHLSQNKIDRFPIRFIATTASHQLTISIESFGPVCTFSCTQCQRRPKNCSSCHSHSPTEKQIKTFLHKKKQQPPSSCWTSSWKRVERTSAWLKLYLTGSEVA